MGTVFEIHDRKVSEKALHAAKAEAERALRAKDAFLAALSHELRTPLTPVLMTAAALEAETEPPPDWRRQISTIRRNVELEARLIDDLLDLTRIAKGKLALVSSTSDLHALLGQAVEIVRADVTGNGERAVIRFDLQAEAHHVIGDSARLQQVSWNLLKNAVKFSAPGGEVSVRTWNPAPGRVVVAVTDRGHGIAADFLPRIFTAFEQEETASAHRFGGLGLGLAISKKLVEMHGGTISVESAGRGLGATFTVEFATTTAPSPNKISLIPKESDAPRTLRLLVVEDHAPTLDVLVRLLRRRGHDVTTATSVREALERAAAQRFDFVVSDVGLPDGTGTEVMQELSVCYGLRGVALSGYGMEEDLARSREAGFVAHLTKPVNFNQLQRVLDEVVVQDG